MPYIESSIIDDLQKKLTKDLSQLGKLYKSKKNPFYVKSVDHNLVDQFLQDGWEEFDSPLKTKTKMRKIKPHDIKFEDDIWCQLYDLGYRHFNYDRNFSLPYDKNVNDKKQIDVVAIHDDTILLIECKSAKEPTRSPSFKSDFEALPRLLGCFQKTFDQMFGKGKKIKYLFATRNLRLDRSSQDIKRLEATNSFFYNDNTYDYVQSLIKNYKGAAHYQFQGLLFKGQLINKEKIEVPAIEGKMGSKTYYMFSIEPALLLKMGFILHRTRANESEMPTYQRLLVPSRLKGIVKFIDNGGYFPNTAIINFSSLGNRLQFEPTSRTEDSQAKPGILKIPNAFAIAYIIDGQHRIYGYAQSKYKQSDTIPVVAFKDLSSSEQLEIFMDINQNQKAVSPTLRITLEEDLYWDADRADSRLKALRSSVISRLTGDIASPLYGLISIGEDKAKLTAKPFYDALTRCGLLPSAKGNKLDPETVKTSLYDTSNHNHQEEMGQTRERIVCFLNSSYQYVEDEFPDLYKKPDKNFIISNRGTYAFISLLGSLNAFESINQKFTPQTPVEERVSALKKYIQELMDKLKNLPPKELDTLFGKYGSGSDQFWLMYFENLVNQTFKEYEPPELTDWKERQDQDLQDRGRRLGEIIESHMKHTIISKLKVLFGNNWDIEIGAIQRECEKRAKEDMERMYKEGLGRKEIKWTEMFLITDYKKVIEKYWVKVPDLPDENFIPFSDTFSIDIGLGFNSKADKIKWISVFNSHRNLWAHKGTKEKNLNREEVEFLQQVHDALIN